MIRFKPVRVRFYGNMIIRSVIAFSDNYWISFVY